MNERKSSLTINTKIKQVISVPLNILLQVALEVSLLL